MANLYRITGPKHDQTHLVIAKSSAGAVAFVARSFHVQHLHNVRLSAELLNGIEGARAAQDGATIYDATAAAGVEDNGTRTE
jgi:hypothetical protein